MLTDIDHVGAGRFGNRRELVHEDVRVDPLDAVEFAPVVEPIAQCTDLCTPCQPFRADRSAQVLQGALKKWLQFRMDRYTSGDPVVDLTGLAVNMDDDAIALEKGGIVAG